MITTKKAYSLIKNELYDGLVLKKLYQDKLGYVFIMEDTNNPDMPGTPCFQVSYFGKVLPFSVPPMENLDRLEKAKKLNPNILNT